MPPWHAAAGVGEFENDRRLSAAEKDTIARWVAAGAPEGVASDLPAPPKYAEGWTIGQPDAVLTMQEDYAAPAHRHHRLPVLRGADQLHRRQVDPGLRSAAQQPRRGPSRDRLRAPAGAGAAGRGTRPGRAQRRCSRLPAAWRFRRGRPVGRPLPADQRVAPGPNDRPRAARARRVARRLRAGHAGPAVSASTPRHVWSPARR